MTADQKLLQYIRDKVPEYNPLIAEGVSHHHFASLRQHLDTIIRSIALSFPPGLEYVGLRVFNPEAEVKVIAHMDDVKRRTLRKRVDIARSNVVLTALQFRIYGVPYERAIYTPFDDHDGRIALSGTYYNFVPVLSDKDISVSDKDVFVRLVRGKLTIYKQSYVMRIDGVTQTTAVVYSKVHNYNPKNSKVKPAVTAKTTLAHYLFAKYGFVETFKKYCNVLPIVGNASDIEYSLNPNVKYTFFSSLGLKPQGYRSFHYVKSPLIIAIPADQVTDEVKNLIAGFFFIADYFPDKISADELGTQQETILWKQLMGYIIWGEHLGLGKLIDDCDTHLKSLDEYIDPYVYERFLALGYNTPTLYDLFFLLIKSYENWILDAKDTVSSMFGKEVSVLYYALEPIIRAVVNCTFALSSPAKRRGTLTEGLIKDTINKQITRGVTYSLVRSSTLEVVSYSGDNKAYKFLSALLPQSGAGRRSKQRVPENDPSMQADMSTMCVAEFDGISGADPTGRNRLNLFCNLSQAHITQVHPHLASIITDGQKLIKHH